MQNKKPNREKTGGQGAQPAPSSGIPVEAKGCSICGQFVPHLMSKHMEAVGIKEIELEIERLVAERLPGWKYIKGTALVETLPVESKINAAGVQKAEPTASVGNPSDAACITFTLPKVSHVGDTYNFKSPNGKPFKVVEPPGGTVMCRDPACLHPSHRIKEDPDGMTPEGRARLNRALEESRKNLGAKHD